MKPPILVIADVVDLFATVEEAERYLEPVDVPELQVFDSEGRRLQPVIVQKLLASVVRLEDSQPAVHDVAQVREGLIRLIVANENLQPTSLRDWSLRDLVNKASAYSSR